MTNVRNLLDRSGLRSRWAFVSAATLIYWIGPQSVRLYYPLELNARGASDLIVGIAVATASVAGLLVAVPSGYLLDRFNSQVVLVLSSLGVAIATGGFALPVGVPVMIGLMFVQGLFQTWTWLVLQEMITRVGHDSAAQRQLSLFSVTWGVGLAAGPSIWAALYAVVGFRTLAATCFIFTLLATLSALGVPATLRTVSDREEPAQKIDNEPIPRAPARSGLLVSLRRSVGQPVIVGVMVASFVNIFVQSLRLSFYPLFLEREGVPLATIGVLLSVIGASSLAVRLVLPIGVRRIGQVRMLLGSTWVAILGASMTPVSDSLILLVLGAAMIGAGLGANPPITVALLAVGDSQDRGVAVGLRMVANRLAQVTQPILFGGAAAIIGLAPAFPIAGGLLGLLMIWLRRRLNSANQS